MLLLSVVVVIFICQCWLLVVGCCCRYSCCIRQFPLICQLLVGLAVVGVGGATAVLINLARLSLSPLGH